MGPTDGMALDQPRVVIEVRETEGGGDGRSLGPDLENEGILDTGATSLKVAGDGNLDNEAVDSLDVGGVGGTVTIPLVNLKSLEVTAADGTVLHWSDLVVGVLDIDPSIDGVFGMDLAHGRLVRAPLRGRPERLDREDLFRFPRGRPGGARAGPRGGRAPASCAAGE